MMTGYPPLPAGLKKRALAGVTTRYYPINAPNYPCPPKLHPHPHSQAQPVFKSCGKTPSRHSQSDKRAETPVK